jgi:hypothetical protein
MWREEHLRNVSVLQRVHSPNLVHLTTLTISQSVHHKTKRYGGAEVPTPHIFNSAVGMSVDRGFNIDIRDVISI